MNYKCTVSYKGSNYYGWAKQNELPTVEFTICNAFKELFGFDVNIYGSGRTDRYVHAIGQVFSVKHDEINMESEQLMQALNSKLPKDIRIIDCVTVDEKFHARFLAKEKTYIYKVSIHPTYNLFTEDLIYQYNRPIDFAKFNEFKEIIIGKHNFLSFSTSEIKDTVREVYEFNVEQNGDVVNFIIRGNGFLRNMVRMIVGCFLNYIEGRIDLEGIKNLIDNPKKGQAIRKVNGCGLYLYKVEY